jgi:hypothetical protein
LEPALVWSGLKKVEKENKKGLSRRELIIELGKWSKAVGLLTVGSGAVYGLSACNAGGDENSSSGGGTYCNITYCNGCCHNYSTADNPTCYCNYSDYSDTCCS